MRTCLVLLGLLFAVVACGEPSRDSTDTEKPGREAGTTTTSSSSVSSTLSEDPPRTTVGAGSESSSHGVTVSLGWFTGGEDDTATVRASITPGSLEASFSLQWIDSPFRLVLTAPSGRVIDQESTDPDVTVTESSSSVIIVVAEPESGFWHLGVSAEDGVSFDQVSYRITETGAPLHGELSLELQEEAGLPLTVVFGFGEPAGGIAGGEVVARVTDPAGVVRSFPLRDDGGSSDTFASDGVYSARIWATDLAGRYQIEVFASGNTSEGAAVQRQALTEVTLDEKVDTDGDGVADEAEPLFGLDPTDPSDGDTDHDCDGLGLAIELAMGTNPGSWDT
ncbi:MAG TPA: choice-of-anchor X domain-containing protein, partial [Acidimicrobiia bacterium]|nr:choice-of-anchor X domain-containing protein [Acidimicrobiia bacterium]